MDRVMMRKWLWVAGVVLAGASGSVFAAGDDAERARAGEVSAPVVAQSWAEVMGRVVDAQGAPVQGARVVRLGAEGSETLTDEAGAFRLLVARADDQPVSLVFEKRAGSEVLHAVERAEALRAGERTEMGDITLGGACEPQWTEGLFPGDPGMNNLVRALTVFDEGSGSGPVLYAAGEFTTAGGVAVNRIAKWDGSSWSALGTGMNNRVWALTVFDDGSGSGPALYAGGEFSTAGGVTVNRIAKWDGASWSALGTGMNGVVWALTVFDDGSGPALHAGGWFGDAGGVAASRIAKWDGSSWSALGTGMNNSVYALTVFDDGSGSGPALYAGGEFLTAGGVAVSRVAKWDGSSWSTLSGGVIGTVRTLAVFDDGTGPALSVGGEFTTAGGVAANFIANWDGSSWSVPGTGMNDPVYALTVFDDGSGNGPALYAGGSFRTAGGVETDRIAQWDGSSWSAPGTGMNDWVIALTVFDDGSGSGPALYAGGWFTTAGGATANFIVKRDGSSWSALGTGMNSGVSALTVFDDGSGSGPALYAGGDFTTAGGVAANFIAKWDGSSWSALGTGMNNTVSELAVFDDGSGPALYAGGWFTTAGGVAANRIAKWDGSSWSTLGTGMDNRVSALAVFDDGGGPALYAGGSFRTAGGVDTERIAKWDGSSWSALGRGMSNTVSELAVIANGSARALYAGGGFTLAGSAVANRIAKWDGSSWSALGTGMNNTVGALTVFDDGSGSGPALYAGGSFIAAGGVTVNRIAKWGGSSWSALGTGMDSTVHALTVFDDGTGSGPALYAGGRFTTAGGVISGSVARWQGCPLVSAPCPGDANDDGVVDFNDITIILANWLNDYQPGSGLGDANNDGVVDLNDVTVVLGSWLSVCP